MACGAGHEDPGFPVRGRAISVATVDDRLHEADTRPGTPSPARRGPGTTHGQEWGTHLRRRRTGSGPGCAAGPGAFDCSGLTYFAFRRAGFGHIPRTSSAQAGFADRISRARMQRGDLMFFRDGGGVHHVGVLAGAAKGTRYVLHAPSTGGRVRTDRVWTDAWFPGTLRNR